MFATLSAENRIESRLQELGCSAIFLCTLAGIPPTRLNLALRKMKPLSQRDAEVLLDLSNRLVQLRDALSPIPLGLDDPVKVRGLLDQMESRGLTAEDIRKSVQMLFEGGIDSGKF
jgi:hypothetical protein